MDKEVFSKYSGVVSLITLRKQLFFSSSLVGVLHIKGTNSFLCIRSLNKDTIILVISYIYLKSN